ncbi:Ig-like domain-containing protein [Cellulomonas sp.]|uniref:Ig-like domain-containing protein n=1 Tax=Cellulomonas sp. TaxID=40001 RepID=UPI001B217B47|nr:Ig-like domain-containing protein [Cellulomonas sp.]MBO9555843.1 tandem-95 repeat protein [Cellulomonas sp.]
MPRTRSGDTTTGRATRAARRLRTTALATVLAVVVAPFVALGTAVPAQAAITVPFGSVYSTNANGDILMAANTLMTCGAEADCATAQMATSGVYDNNGRTGMRFVDVDSDPSTFNSSSATLTVPPGGAVLFAALVWGGRNGQTATTNADPALRNRVTFVAPGAASRTVTASRVDDNLAAAGAGDVAYAGYADVTSLVQQAGSGVYTVGNVQSKRGDNQYAGWSLVVAVADPSAPARNLTIFSGFGEVTNNGSATISVSGFKTPPSGPVKTTLGAVTFEGDMGKTGDSMSLNGTAIVDALNPAGNSFNSTISNRAAQVGGRNPAYTNQLGFDADLFGADGILANGATSANIALTTSSDQYFPVLVSFATDLYDPKLLGTKTVTDLNGGTAEVGDVLRYTVPVENIGLDAAQDSVFFDAIPTGTTYKPGTVTVDGSTPRTDQAGDDDTQFVPPSGASGQGHILVNLGTGANATKGGTIPVSTGSVQHTVTFDVIVDGTVTNGQQIVNAANLAYSGLSTQAANASATNAVVSPVVAGVPVPGDQPPVAAPHIVTFTPTSSARSTDVAVLAGSSDPEGGALTVVGLTDAAGGSLTINPDGTVTYAPRDDFAGRDVFTYTIQDAAGNRSTALVQVDVANSAPVANDDAATTTAGTAKLVDVLANDTDPNGDTLAIRSVGTSAQGGTVTISGGKARYTPPASFRGTDTFTYVVEDSRGASDEATVTVTVTNNAPVAVADTFDGVAGGTLTFPTVLGNDTDVEGDALTAVLATGPAYGSLVLNANGTGTWNPGTSGFVTTTFTYRASDGIAQSSSVTVTLTVHSAPVANADLATAPSGTAIDVDVLHNDTHPDGSPLTLVSATPGAHGTTSVTGGIVRYTPDDGYAGTDTFTYTVGDGWSTRTATVTVTVLNAAPVASPPSATTPYGRSVTVDLLAGATDLNPGDTLTVVPGSAGVPVDVHGTPRGSVLIAGGVATYTPPAGFSGQVLFTYDVTDGTDVTTVTAAVTVQNGTLPARTTSQRVPTTGAAVLDVLAGLQDPDGGTLTLVSVTQPAHGTVAIVDGTLVYTPEPGWTGTATFTYTVSDGQGGTTTSTLSLDVVAEVLATGPLATTGASGIGSLAGLGALLVLAGLALVVVVGRRRTTA